MTITTNTLQAQFTQAALVKLQNLTTGESYIAQAGPNWLDETLLEADGETLTPGQWAIDSTNPNQAKIKFQDSIRTVNMTAGIADDGDLFVRFDGACSSPGVISLTWGIFGLQLASSRLVIPGQAGTYFDSTSVPSFQGLDYPVHWENQMVVYQAPKGSVLMYSRDTVPYYKRLHASRQTGNLDMAFEMFAVAPWPNATTVPSFEWRMRGYSGDWKQPASTYLSWLKSVRPNVAADGNRSWIKNVRGVVIFETLDSSVLDQLATEVVPQQTILLLTVWRQQPFDIYYPDYTPSDLAKPFIDKAHALGFRVMLHVNLIGVSAVHPDYVAMQPFQIKTANELKPIGWLWDEFPDGSPQRIAYINPAASAYRKLFIDSVRPAVDALHPDALHLDAGGAIVNDGNGLIEGMNEMQGMMQLHRDIMAAYPDLVLGGESTNEIIGPFNWLAQRWQEASPPHPISTYLLGNQLFFYGFLDQPAPDEPDFTEFIKRYEGQGVMPVALIVTASDLAPEHTHTHQILQLMKTFQQKQYLPDWGTDWGGATFQFANADRSSIVRIDDDGHFVSLKIDGNLFYKRVHSANAIATSDFVPNWPAFDNTNLYGLDPNRQYWLDTATSKPASEPHALTLPPNFQIGTGSLITSNYAYLEIAGAQQNWFDFVNALPGANIGTIYNRTDYPLGNGAKVEITRVKVGGVLSNSVLLETPPFRGLAGGATFVEYSVPVPIAPKVSLSFNAGIADGATGTDGVLAGIKINGTTMWEKSVQPGAWIPGSIDLTPFGGQTVKIRLIVHPGLSLNPLSDWACWDNIQIVTDFSTTTLQPVEVPGVSTTPLLSEGATLQSLSGDVAEVSLPVPGNFVIFKSAPPSIQLGQSLLDMPIDVWSQGYDGIASQTPYEGSGAIEAVSSNGVPHARAIKAFPPHDGYTILTIPVTVPASASQLVVDYALADSPSFGPTIQYSGVEFTARINGKTVADEAVQTAGWHEVMVNLNGWQGKPVLVELIVDSQHNQLFDFAYWSNLTVQ